MKAIKSLIFTCLLPATVLGLSYLYLGDVGWKFFVGASAALLIGILFNYSDGIKTGINIGRMQVFAYIASAHGIQEAERLFGSKK